MVVEKNYTLRELKADDIFLVVKIVNKIGFKEMKGCFNSPEVRTAISSATSGKEVDMSAVGMTVMLEIAGLVLEHLPTCKEDIYALLATLSGKTKEEVANLSSGVFTKMVMDVIRKDEFKDFFQDVFGFQK